MMFCAALQGCSVLLVIIIHQKGKTKKKNFDGVAQTDAWAGENEI